MKKGLKLSNVCFILALGMGMDDTRMDLSQLQEGSGRSVPSTPLSLSAPGNFLQYYWVGTTTDSRSN